MALPAVIESGLNEAGTAIAVIVHPERGAAAILEYVNQPFSAVLRKTPHDLTGAPLQRVLDLVGTTECQQRLLQALQSGKASELDIPLVVGAAESWLGFRLSFPPPDGSGLQTAILIGRDITKARKNATQEDKMRQMLAHIFMRINAPVAIIGRAGELVMCNTAFRQLTGFTAEELKRKRVQDFTPPDLLEISTKAREAQFVDGERYEMATETLAKGGRRVAVQLTSILLSDSDQHYRVVTLIPRDVASGDAKLLEAAALTAAVHACATRDRGELRAISLDALRSSFGADWERIATRAMMRAEQAIRKRLERDDVLSRLNETFVLWFNNGDQTRNDATLQAIVRDVRLTFLTEFGEEISSHVSATLVPGTQAARPPAGPVAAAKPKSATVHYTSMETGAVEPAADEITSQQGRSGSAWQVAGRR